MEFKASPLLNEAPLESHLTPSRRWPRDGEDGVAVAVTSPVQLQAIGASKFDSVTKGSNGSYLLGGHEAPTDLCPRFLECP